MQRVGYLQVKMDLICDIPPPEIKGFGRKVGEREGGGGDMHFSRLGFPPLPFLPGRET